MVSPTSLSIEEHPRISTRQNIDVCANSLTLTRPVVKTDTATHQRCDFLFFFLSFFPSKTNTAPAGANPAIEFPPQWNSGISCRGLKGVFMG